MLRCIPMWLKLIANNIYVDAQQRVTRSINRAKGWSNCFSLRFNLRHKRLRIYGLFLSTVIVVLWGGVLLTSPIFAAMRLNYFDVLVNAEQITLEWSTASENEVLGFEVECKKEEPNSQYHVIGKRLAQGNKDHGAIYRFDIIDGLEPNTSYCFRLHEITLNGEQGEIIDRCGYGLDITPTPATTPTEAIELIATITDTLVITPMVEMTATIEQPLFLTATPLPAETAIPVATTINEQASPGEITPTDTPIIPTATATVFSESPLIPPVPTPVAQPNNNQTSAAALEAQTALTDSAVSAVATNIISTTSTAPQPEGMDTAVVVANPPYIVLTVTPTEAALAVASTFTPFPTAASDTEPNFVAATLPSTQNMMILLLCGVFSGASGLGLLGLVTTLLYMRSRTAEQQQRRK